MREKIEGRIMVTFEALPARGRQTGGLAADATSARRNVRAGADEHQVVIAGIGSFHDRLGRRPRFRMVVTGRSVRTPRTAPSSMESFWAREVFAGFVGVDGRVVAAEGRARGFGRHGHHGDRAVAGLRQVDGLLQSALVVG